MAFGFVMDVPAPAEIYDALHAEVNRRTSVPVDGLLLHIGRATPDGFQVIEVWETREQSDRFNEDVVLPALAQLTEGGPPMPAPPRQEFEPRGLIVPSAQLVV
jgi:hypothetical protein